MVGFSDKLSPVKRLSVGAMVVCAVLMLSACSVEPAKQAYRDSSDWLNDIPDPPADGPWRLSKRIGPADGPYPNLGDVPDRPVQDVAQLRMDRQILEGEQVKQGTALSTPVEGRASAAELGAPPPARLAPISIPPAQ